MLREKSEIAFWSEESWVESIACIFYLSGHFQLEMTETQLRPASTQRGSLLLYEDVRAWRGEAGGQRLLRPDASTTRSQGENWLNWGRAWGGGGAEESRGVSLPVSEPEKVTFLAPAL